MKESRSIMAALDYSIISLQNLKKGLINPDKSKKELVWAVSGLIITLTSNLLSISQSVISNAAKQHNPDALSDIKEIQARFNKFVNTMVNHE